VCVQVKSHLLALFSWESYCAPGAVCLQIFIMWQTVGYQILGPAPARRNERSTELYWLCLIFIATDSIVDVISFITCIVLWSQNKFSGRIWVPKSGHRTDLKVKSSTTLTNINLEFKIVQNWWHYSLYTFIYAHHSVLWRCWKSI